MNWQVIETQYFSEFESPKEKIVAQFDTLVLAEDFVNLVIPKDTRDRFKIEHINKEAWIMMILLEKIKKLEQLEKAADEAESRWTEQPSVSLSSNLPCHISG